MKQRILVAVIGIPLLLLVLCWAPHWATAALLAAMCLCVCLGSAFLAKRHRRRDHSAGAQGQRNAEKGGIKH